MVLAFFIRAEYRVAQALRALAVRQLITKARRTDFIIKPVVQVTVYYLTHIDITLFHIFIMLVLHVDHNVASLMQRGGPSYALYHSSPRHSGSGCPHTTHVRTVAGGSSCVNFSQYGQTIAPYSADFSHEAQVSTPLT